MVTHRELRSLSSDNRLHRYTSTLPLNNMNETRVIFDLLWKMFFFFLHMFQLTCDLSLWMRPCLDCERKESFESYAGSFKCERGIFFTEPKRRELRRQPNPEPLCKRFVTSSIPPQANFLIDIRFPERLGLSSPVLGRGFPAGAYFILNRCSSRNGWLSPILSSSISGPWDLRCYVPSIKISGCQFIIFIFKFVPW
jgi:hypothetical protein